MALVPPAARELDFALLSEATYRLADQPTLLGAKVAAALKVIDEALERYGPRHVALSFNGGKDCTALLHLARAALYRYNAAHDSGSGSTPLTALNVLYRRSFSEVDEFVKHSVDRYKLNLVEAPGPMRQGLQAFKDGYPHIQAVLVGTRRGDPYSNSLSAFSPTDPGWPRFMRVNPVLDWSFDDIWEYMRSDGVCYCCLYDQGYTSLGDVDSTERNPALLKNGRYQPAWSLANHSLERSGRSSASSAGSAATVPVSAPGRS
ncbi:FAD1 flavin adenine dinucleotide synthetase [Coemansia sp. RSA 552]|nr:FAD1 flavin adenine dinucleotide synthetase [Coemansia sp. RSA 552]